MLMSKKNVFHINVLGLLQSKYLKSHEINVMSYNIVPKLYYLYLHCHGHHQTNLNKGALNPSGHLFSNNTNCPFSISSVSCAFIMSIAIQPVTTLTKSVD